MEPNVHQSLASLRLARFAIERVIEKDPTLSPEMVADLQKAGEALLEMLANWPLTQDRK